MMSVYLHDIPLSEAQERFMEALVEAGREGLLGYDEIEVDEKLLNRVLAEPIWAKISSPHYHASAMDGFALRANSTEGAGPRDPILFPIQTSKPNTSLDDNLPKATYVNTGDPLPIWADAVVPIENVESIDNYGEPAVDPRNPIAIRIRAAISPWANVRSIGEDIVATELVFPEGHLIRAIDIGAIAACGHDKIKVARKPQVTIIPTGTELVPVGQTIQPGRIIEFNSLVLAAQIQSWGGIAIRMGIVKDDYDAIRSAVVQAADQSDLILLIAGSSAGSEDFSASVIQATGRLIVHGVAVRPGHPVILGMVNVAENKHARKHGKSSGIPIIGVPGYPVSAALTGEIFIEPLVAMWLGRSIDEPVEVEAKLTRKVTSPAGDDEFLRVAIGRVGDQLLAAPLPGGAGMITSMVRADGIAMLPRGSQGLPAGSEIKVRLSRPLSKLERTIFIIGSHDICLDLLAQQLAHDNRRVSSVNAGSLAGLLAIRRNQTHLAGSHLLDTETGEYNLSYIQKYIVDVAVKLVYFVGRQQGLIVQKANPKGIFGISDLLRDDVVYINRQRGAGTRILLDYYLKQLQIPADQVNGYENEQYSHLAVAASIASGRCDCGLGIAAAANAMDLEFIPLHKEEYHLIIPAQYYSSELLEPLLDALSNDRFRNSVSAIPGYDISGMGEVVAEYVPDNGLSDDEPFR